MHPVVFEVIILVGLALFVLVQVVIPAITGNPLFSLFRTSRKGVSLAESELLKALTEEDEAITKRRAVAIRRRLAQEDESDSTADKE